MFRKLSRTIFRKRFSEEEYLEFLDSETFIMLMGLVVAEEAGIDV